MKCCLCGRDDARVLHGWYHVCRQCVPNDPQDVDKQQVINSLHTEAVSCLLATVFFIATVILLLGFFFL